VFLLVPAHPGSPADKGPYKTVVVLLCNIKLELNSYLELKNNTPTSISQIIDATHHHHHHHQWICSAPITNRP